MTFHSNNMKDTSTYSTHGAALTLAGVIFYCYNDKMIGLQDFVILEKLAYEKAAKKRWKLFKYTETPEIELFLGLN